MCLMQVCVFCRGAFCSPFISCDSELPPRRRGRADCSVLPVFFNKPGTVASSFTQTRVWSDCQTAKAYSLHHAPHLPQLPVLCLHHSSSQTHSLTAHRHVLQLWTWILLPTVSTSQLPFHFLMHPHSPPNRITLPPSSSTRGYTITHFGGNHFPPEQPKQWAYSLHHNSSVAKLLSHRVCHANVALGTTILPLKYCDGGVWSVLPLLEGRGVVWRGSIA